VQKYLLEHERGHANMLHTTIAPTMLQAGFRIM